MLSVQAEQSASLVQGHYVEFCRFFGTVKLIFLDSNHRVWQALQAIAAEDGLAIYDLELGAPGSLRVFIERGQLVDSIDLDPHDDGQMEDLSTESTPSRAGRRVTSGDCSRFVRRLMAFFLTEGEGLNIAPEPKIEVSSPGMNRNLRTAEHFHGALGERILVQAAEPILGNLTEFDGEMLKILDGNKKQPVDVRLSEIKKARVEFAFK